jgi:hypothetical protein
MSQSQLRKSHTNTNRQDNIVMGQLQVLGTIPRSTRGSTRKDAKEPVKLGKFLRTDRTIRRAAADCPQERGGLFGKTGTGCPEYKSPLQPKKQHLYPNGPQNGSRPLADCPPAADCPLATECPPTTRERSVEELRRKQRTRKNTSPKSSQISQTVEALEPRFGGDDMRHWVMLCPKTLWL